MLRLAQDKSAWELKNEANKANVHWLLIIVIGSYLAYLLESKQAAEIGGGSIFNWYYIGSVTVSKLQASIRRVPAMAPRPFLRAVTLPASAVTAERRAPAGPSTSKA